MATSIVLYGVESSFSPEFVESARRASVIIAGAIIAGEPEWDMEGLPVEPAHHLDVALRTIEFVIPWVTPGIRFRRWQQACPLSGIGQEQDPLRSRLRTRQPLHQAACSVATLSCVSAELRLNSENQPSSAR